MKPNKRATILTLLERATPQREIARITGIDRKTVRSYQKRWLGEQANSPGVATGSEQALTLCEAQIPPPRPPAGAPVASSRCEPHREFIEAQVRLGRNGVAIYQDLVEQHGIVNLSRRYPNRFVDAACDMRGKTRRFWRPATISTRGLGSAILAAGQAPRETGAISLPSL